jgi:hypothetical protein
MPSASIAEWMVSRFTGRKRAASIVGDLLELKPQKGSLWFWLSLARVVIALAWRRPLAFVAAFMFGAWACAGLQSTESLGINSMLSHQFPWMNLFWTLFYMLWFVLVYTAIRYGLRDRVAQLAFALTALTTALVYYGRQPAVLVPCLAVSVFVVVASIWSRERRRAAQVLLVVALVGFAVGLPAMRVADQYLNFIVPMPRRVEGMQAQIQAHPSVSWVYLTMIFATVWMMTIACSRMHNWLMRNHLPDSKIESKSAS